MTTVQLNPVKQEPINGKHSISAEPTKGGPSSTNNITSNDDDDGKVVGKELLKTLIAAGAGNFLEWFDFALFGLLADEIGSNFFPASLTSTGRLIQSFTVFSSAFFMRPIGGAFFGYIGDKYGRIFALRLSIFMMAIPTFLTGCLPTYNQIGYVSTILLILFRLIQGMSVGGELTGALVYVIEVCPPNRKTFYTMIVQISGTGTLLATAIEAILRGTLTDTQLYKWGWRIPFFFGIVVAYFGVWMRKGLKESIEYEQNKRNENSVWYIIRQQYMTIIYIILHLCMFAAGYYAIFIWLPTYLAVLRDDPITQAYGLNVMAMVVTFFGAVFSAYIADIYTPTKVILIFGPVFMVTILITFPILQTSGIFVTGLLQCFLGITAGLASGPGTMWALYRLHDVGSRMSGMGIAYNIALACFGGTAPIIGTAIVSKKKYCDLCICIIWYGNGIIFNRFYCWIIYITIE